MSLHGQTRKKMASSCGGSAEIPKWQVVVYVIIPQVQVVGPIT